jgi:Extended Signal Peptide of Type V secretion system
MPRISTLISFSLQSQLFIGDLDQFRNDRAYRRADNRDHPALLSPKRSNVGSLSNAQAGQNLRGGRSSLQGTVTFNAGHQRGYTRHVPSINPTCICQIVRHPSFMNRIFKAVWNETSGTWVSASETSKSKSKRSSSARKLVMVQAAMIGGLLAASSGYAQADGWVAAGDNVFTDSVAAGATAWAQGDQATAVGSGGISFQRLRSRRIKLHSQFGERCRCRRQFFCWAEHSGRWYGLPCVKG